MVYLVLSELSDKLSAVAACMLRQSWSHRLIQIFSEGTFDNDVQWLALRREIMGENIDAINTAIVPYVGVVSSKEQEVGRVIVYTA